jgi:dTDP-4-dehydrorhamnose reductase
VPILRKDYDILDNNVSKIVAVLGTKGIQAGDVIVNCAGAISQRDFSLNKYVHINSLFPHQLEIVAAALSCKYIHVTTDCVFNGREGCYTEDHAHDCEDWYGKSKSLGEPQNSCCIRTSIVGLGSAGNVSLLDWFSNCKDNKVNGFVNHFWNGLTCLELSAIIIDIARHNLLWKGCRHVFSEPVSKYQLLKIYNNTFKIGKYIKPVYADERCDRTLGSKFHTAIPKTIQQQLIELKGFHNEEHAYN